MLQRPRPSFFALLLAAFLSFAALLAGAATLQAQGSSATATVLVDKLNVRSGPGTTYARIGGVVAGDVLTVTGQAQTCAWLKVQTRQLSGWVSSGGSTFVKLSVPCSKVPAATADAKQPAPTVAPGAAATTTVGAVPTAKPPAPTAVPTAQPAATPAPEPAATPEPEAEAEAEAEPQEDPLPSDMACFLMRNEVGPELNVTITSKDSGKGENFKVPAGGETVWCLYPGRYTATVDAPPPWADLNTEFTVEAGERFEWPIMGVR
jgi:serine protease Do